VRDWGLAHMAAFRVLDFPEAHTDAPPPPPARAPSLSAMTTTTTNTRAHLLLSPLSSLLALLPLWICSWVYSNQLSGSIPTEVGLMTSLFYL
jgi:hypothetical protein